MSADKELVERGEEFNRIRRDTIAGFASDAQRAHERLKQIAPVPAK